MWPRSKRPAPDAAAARGPGTERPAPVSILLVTGQFLPVIGGTELTTLREAKALRARGHAVRVLTLRLKPQWPSTEEVEGVPVRRIGGLFLRGRLRLRFGATWLAEALIWLELVRTRHTYDVVQLRQLSRLARPVALARLVTGKPLVVRIACAPAPPGREASHAQTAREGAPPATQKGEPQERRLIPDADDVGTLRRTQYLAPLTLRLLRSPRVTCLALSARIREYLIESGFGEHQIVHVPNGVDATAYEDVAAHRAHRPPPAPDDALTVVCSARLSYQKGQDVLLQAWRIVQERLSTARLILAGEGPQRPEFEHLTANLGMADTVAFAGLVSDMRGLLASAHAFALPSRSEGMSNALLEAMAAGLPCVATRVSGSEDAIVEGQSGLLVPPEDPEALARALIAILTDHERARALGREARARILQRFDQRRVLDELIQLYASLAKNSATTQPGRSGHAGRNIAWEVPCGCAPQPCHDPRD
jgi:glycosyltransferase involved in cell wall biosynthesis